MVTEQKTLTTVEKVLFLKTVNIFAHASIEDLGRVAELTEAVGFETGESIYREGEPVESIHIILKGSVAVESNGTKLREVRAGEPLGVLAAFDLNSALHTVTAIEPVDALKLNVQDFQDVLSLDFDLVKAVFRAIAQRLRQGL